MNTSINLKNNSEFIIFTIGHSNHSIEYFISLLKKYKIDIIADIRRFPTSRKFPHFNKENLIKELAKNNIEYIWLGNELGGFRKSKHSKELFAGYKEHMESELYQKGENILLSLVKEKRLAIMCAENLYFKCHRLLLSRSLLEKGIKIIHIKGDGKCFNLAQRETQRF